MYDESNNSYNYSINVPQVKHIHDICNLWVKKYYEVYQLLVRLRFDYWNQDNRFCEASKRLYSSIKRKELEFVEELVSSAEKDTLSRITWEKKIISYDEIFQNSLDVGKRLYDQVIDRKGPLYVDFKIR